MRLQRDRTGNACSDATWGQPHGRTISSRIHGARMWLPVCFFVFLMGVSAMSQAQSSLEDLQKRRAIAEAEKAAIDAEIARDDSKKKLVDSQAPADPAKKTQEARLEAAKSAKSIADAEKAQADAELAAASAKIGAVPSSGISGSVKVEQGAASFETALLAARATVTASEQIAIAVVAATGTSASTVPAPAGATAAKKLLVFAAGEVPDFQATTGFLAQRAVVLQALVDAVSESEDAKKPLAAPGTTESIAAVGVALEAVTKLLGFFKSDFEVRGNDVAADHALLAKVVTGELLKKRKDFEPTLYLKAAFNPTSVAAVGTLFKKDLESLNFQRNKAVSALTERELDVSSLQTESSKIAGETAADKEKRRQLGEQQKRHQGAVDKLKSALTAYDTLVGKLASPDASVAAMIREYEVWSALNDPSSLMLIVKMDKAGGSNYVEKNLWTSFGVMPFKVMGGVIASYTLFQGSSGAVLAAGVVPVHGGYKKVNEVGDLFR